MIIYIKHYEQLCNRLWAFVPTLSYALHYNKKILMIWALKKYLDYFPNLRKSNTVISIFEYKKFHYRRLIKRIFNLYEKTIMATKTYRQISPFCPIIFSPGWNGREDKAFIVEEKRKIIDLFKPANKVIDKIEKYIKKANAYCYVGVHIRGGDYAVFLKGRFYYSLDSYFKRMEQLYLLLKSEGYTNIKFLICSNEKIDIHNLDLYKKYSFTTNDILRIEDSDEITDLYALSMCDYIIGPPSTFSLWAAFYGEKKIRFLQRSDDCILSLSEFKTIKFYDEPLREFFESQKK